MANLDSRHRTLTTAAFGIKATGQAAQLPLYDEYARNPRPNLVTLVFTGNDFADNSPVLQGVRHGLYPERLPFASVRRGADGALRLFPPHRGGGRALPAQKTPLWLRIWREALKESSFAAWAAASLGLSARDNAQSVAWAQEIRRRPGYESFWDGWDPAKATRDLQEFFAQPEPPPTFQEALRFTAFALDEFQRRAERDGAALVILATHIMGPSDDPLFQRLAAMAGERGIPVVNQHDYIDRVGGNVKDAHFKRDLHWSPQGHQWAAEALMEWLRENPQVCGDA